MNRVAFMNRVTISGRPLLLQKSHTSRKINGVWQQSVFSQDTVNMIEDGGNRLSLDNRPGSSHHPLKNRSFSL